MPTVSEEHYIFLAMVLFGIGALGVLVRRNAIVIFMCIEMMLNAANLALITFANHHQDTNGHIYVLLVMAIAAAEVSVGLAIMIAVFRRHRTVDVDELNSLRG